MSMQDDSELINFLVLKTYEMTDSSVSNWNLVSNIHTKSISLSNGKKSIEFPSNWGPFRHFASLVELSGSLALGVSNYPDLIEILSIYFEMNILEIKVQSVNALISVDVIEENQLRMAG